MRLGPARDLHRLRHAQGTHVQHPTKQARKTKHVVDLVRIIRPARGHHPRARHRRFRSDLGIGIGQREHDRIGGHELSFGADLADSWKFSGNYTFLSAIDEGEVAYWYDNALPLRPMHEGYARLEYDPRDWVRLWSDFNYVSGDYWDRANLYLVPQRQIYNAGAAVDVLRRDTKSVITVSLEGKNLGDNRIADVAGYPLPGRSFYVSLAAKW